MLDFQGSRNPSDPKEVPKVQSIRSHVIYPRPLAPPSENRVRATTSAVQDSTCRIFNKYSNYKAHYGISINNHLTNPWLLRWSVFS